MNDIGAILPVTGTMLHPTMERVIRWILPGMLLIVVSCGDFQDPASGLAPHNAAVSDPHQAETASLLLSPMPHESGDVADTRILDRSVPSTSVGSDPIAASGTTPFASSDATGAVPQSTTDLDGPGRGASAFQHSSAASTPSQTQMEQASPALSTGESRVSPVTLAWDPSSSGNATGYQVHVLSLPSRLMFTTDAGPSTSLTLTLPTGETYFFSVTAYNAAGESDRSAYLKHMLP